MLVCNLGDISQIEECEPLSNLPVWNREIEGITDTEWQAVYALLVRRVGKIEAIRCLKSASNEAMKEYMLNDIPKNSLITFRVPVDHISPDDLLRVMEKFDAAEQAIVTSALLSGKDVGKVAAMSRKEAMTELCMEAREIAKEFPAHIRSSFAFWRENETGQPVPVLGVRKKIFDLTGLSWFDFSNVAGRVIH